LILLIPIPLLGVLLYPPEEGGVVLGMETDVGQDLSNKGQDPGIVGVGLQIVGQLSTESWIRVNDSQLVTSAIEVNSQARVGSGG
jgi:hypothetical protein